MFRNSLPFAPGERDRYPRWSRARLRLTLLKLLQRRSMRRADGVIFLSSYARRLGLDSFTPADHVMIPHGVDERFRAQPRPQRPLSDYSDDEPFRFLYVSHIDLYKHQNAVVEAFARLRDDGLPVALDLVGHVGNRHAESQMRAVLDRRDPRQRHLRFVGPVPFAELDRTYRSTEAFVFASTCENLPNTLLEAMAAGLPIASSRSGPMPEVLQEAGLYFEATDPDSIAEAARALATDPSLRARLARESASLAANYSWRSCADRTFDYLRKQAHAIRS